MGELPISHTEPGAEPQRRVVFTYDFSSPECYLALEEFVKPMAKLAPELLPVRSADLDLLDLPDDAARRQWIEQHAAGSSVLPLVWPAAFPHLDTADAVRVAGYAKSIGKVAVFSLSLFRQIYAAGNDPADVNTLYLAAVASEIHPRAVDQALSRDSVLRAADQATERARAAGVRTVPTLQVDGRTIVGPAIFTDAAAAIEDAAGRPGEPGVR